MIARVGKPEDFGTTDEEEKRTSSGTSAASATYTSRRRLYRNSDAYGDAGYTKILFYGVGTAVLGVIAAVWAIAQAKKVAKRNAAAANAA